MFSKLFIFSAVILISIVILFSCNKNPINEYNNDYAFWLVPKGDALILFFRFSDELEVDSLFAGQIQFRLDCARTVDKKVDSIFAMRSWELGVLLLGISDDLYNNFNPETSRFNY